MIRITLDDATRDELRSLRRAGLPPKVRDRIEMVTLADAGWSAPRIADHLGYHPQTVRDLLRAFLARGAAALYPARGGPAPDAEHRDRVTGAIRELLGRRRTWTSGQLSRALAESGVALGPRQVRRYLRRMGARYRRTASTLKHKQDPAKAARAGRVLANLKAKSAAGRMKLYYLDECGFSPTLPTGDSWALPGRRKRWSTRPGRAGGSTRWPPTGPMARRRGSTSSRPSGRGSRTTCWASSGRRPGRWRRRSSCWTTPACIPRGHPFAEGRAGPARHLPLFPAAVQPGAQRDQAGVRHVKYHEMPQRSHTTRPGLRESV
jgi:transposase